MHHFIYLHIPSQSPDGFETFTENFELSLENSVQKNPFLVVAIRNFNAKSGNWFCQDKTSFEGDAIENLMQLEHPSLDCTRWIYIYIYIRYFLLMYWPDLYATAKFDNWVRSSFVSTFKLLSSNNFCKI